MIKEETTGIVFANELRQTEDFNVYLYRNFYNGAGVGLGDFNNDGRTDIYFCGNQVDNHLYINQGGMHFAEMAKNAGVSCPDVWCTGVSIVDINGDGWQDIYVCKSGNPEGGNRYNELFINNGNLTFSEQAKKYGIADKGLSSHAAFFDYDKDGDLDCYLLNNAFKSIDQYALKKDQRLIRDPDGGNKLYRNDGGKFTDVSQQAGIYGSAIGFGLGVTVGDIDKDGWQDIYVSNDFFEKDYLYINQHDGTFRECLEEQLREISMGSMGADMADINNDGFPEIYVTEMLPKSMDRVKTKVVYASWQAYQHSLEQGYYHQFARNTLQLNNQNGTFSEIGRMAGVAASDWSWGALICDLDMDGRKDIFVANGIFRDLLDQDYLTYYSNPQHVRDIIMNKKQGILGLIGKMPSVQIPNCAFANTGQLSFADSAKNWGLDMPGFSNGAAYGDLDNDGDLDLVVNNINAPAFIYQNKADQYPNRHFLKLKLVGVGLNKDAIGTQVTVHAGKQQFYQELMPMKGFMSCVDHALLIGLGTNNIIDSVSVKWPDLTVSKYKHIATDTVYELYQAKALKVREKVPEIHETPFSVVTKITGLDFIHREDHFNDFERNKLLFHMKSTEGPKMDVADINGDGLDDVYFCGAKGQAGALFVQTKKGFWPTEQEIFSKDKLSEETDCLFFDADNDGDADLYVACGGNQFPSSSTGLADRLYFNDGKGHFTKSDQILPSYIFTSTSCVRATDFDGDGDQDLFVGTRLKPFYYGMDESSFLLQNDGKGTFTDVTTQRASDLKNIGLVTDAFWADIDQDGDDDLMVAGEWMPVRLFLNDAGILKPSVTSGMEHTVGWWNTLTPVDLDGDGDIDFAAGNLGRNTFLKASEAKPLKLYINDFDLNGSVEQILCVTRDSGAYPLPLKNDLVAQIPTLASKYTTFDQYKNQRIEDIFAPDILAKSIVKEVYHLESALFINRGNGKFDMINMPVEAQEAPVYAICATDVNKDNYPDLIIGGNLSGVKPQLGSYMASYGLCLLGDEKNALKSMRATQSGFSVTGEIRDIKPVTVAKKKYLVVAKNNDQIQIFKYD